MATSDLPRPCRACGAALPATQGGPRSHVAPCVGCGYLNVVDEGEIELPLPGLTAPDAGHGEVVSALTALAERRLEEARAAVAAELPAATAFFLDALVERDQRLAGMPGGYAYEAGVDAVTFNLATQLLYLLLAERGGPDLRHVAGDTPAYAHLGRTLWPLLTEATFLPKQLAQIEAGIGTFASRRGRVVMAKTDLHTRMQEWHANQRHWEDRFKETPRLALEDPAFAAAQGEVLGFSAARIFELCDQDLAELSVRLRVVRREALRCIVTDDGAPALAEMLDSMTLSLDRALRFAIPFYFDLGRRRSAPATRLPAGAAGLNWTAYYPFMAARAARGGEPMLLTTPQLLRFAFANMEGSRAQMFSRLLDAVGQDPPRRARIAALGREISARLEADVAVIAEAAGYAARPGLDAVPGRRLDCGEIDTLAARTEGGVTRLLVVEAKDVDMPLYRPGAYAQSRDTVLRGAAQAERKAAWVAANWRAAASALGITPGASAQVLPILVTRRYVPPGIASVPAVFPAAMPALLQRIAAGQHGAASGTGPVVVIPGAA